MWMYTVNRQSFSIGFTFYYWDYYQHKDHLKEHYGNRNDLMGYRPHQLYVKAKYGSIKEEIMNNNIYQLNYVQYNLSLIKAQQHMQTAKVKSMISAQYAECKLHYQIGETQPISIEHLLSIILRCDWTELCTRFSSTFRRIQPFEELICVKRRNAEFAILSRLIRETVEYYGQRGMGDYDPGVEEYVNKVNGPFYCGMDMCMMIPQFVIRLCGPISITKQIEVAQRFAGDTGMIMQFNNSGHCNANRLSIFDCSWISNYSGEDEYLLAGGKYPIRIESIRNVQTKENYEQFCKALFYFNCIIRGITVENDAFDITDDDYQLLQDLMDHKLHKDRKNTHCPEFIVRAFDSMTNFPSRLIIDLHQINSSFSKLKDLFLLTDATNCYLIKDTILRLLPNIKKVMIYTTNGNGTKAYPMDLELFQSQIKTYSWQKVENIVIEATRFEWEQEAASWLFHEYNQKIKSHETDETNKQHVISMTYTFDHEGIMMDCLSISHKDSLMANNMSPISNLRIPEMLFFDPEGNSEDSKDSPNNTQTNPPSDVMETASGQSQHHFLSKKYSLSSIRNFDTVEILGMQHGLDVPWMNDSYDDGKDGIITHRIQTITTALFLIMVTSFFVSIAGSFNRDLNLAQTLCGCGMSQSILCIR